MSRSATYEKAMNSRRVARLPGEAYVDLPKGVVVSDICRKQNVGQSPYYR